MDIFFHLVILKKCIAALLVYIDIVCRLSTMKPRGGPVTSSVNKPSKQQPSTVQRLQMKKHHDDQLAEFQVKKSTNKNNKKSSKYILTFSF